MKIEKGIAIPESARLGVPANQKYPLRFMEVGDSFLVDSEAQRMSVMAAAWYLGRAEPTHKRRFASRKTDEGFRIWRVE